MVVLPLSPGPIKQFRPDDGRQERDRIDLKFWISILQIRTTQLLLWFHLLPANVAPVM
jgi:hypothetical protein